MLNFIYSFIFEIYRNLDKFWFRFNIGSFMNIVIKLFNILLCINMLLFVCFMGNSLIVLIGF